MIHHPIRPPPAIPIPPGHPGYIPRDDCPPLSGCRVGRHVGTMQRTEVIGREAEPAQIDRETGQALKRRHSRSRLPSLDPNLPKKQGGQPGPRTPRPRRPDVTRYIDTDLTDLTDRASTSPSPSLSPSLSPIAAPRLPFVVLMRRRFCTLEFEASKLRRDCGSDAPLRGLLIADLDRLLRDIAASSVQVATKLLPDMV